MCSQEAVLCPSGALSAVRGAGGRGQEPVPVPSPAGRGEGAGQPSGAGPHRHRDPALAEQRRTGGDGEGKTLPETQGEEIGLIPLPVCAEFACPLHVCSCFLYTKKENSGHMTQLLTVMNDECPPFPISCCIAFEV